MTAHKGSLGHLYTAAGAIETALCFKALEDFILPPIVNLEKPLTQSLNFVQGRAIVRPDLNIIVKNSLAFGGVNAALVLKRYEPTPSL